LLAKRTVDDRALNQRVVDELRALLMSRGRRTHRVLELGAGVGTMVTRLVDWAVVDQAEYTLLDQDESSLDAARRELQSWSGVPVKSGILTCAVGPVNLQIRLEHGEAFEFMAAEQNKRGFDLVVANAVVDLMDLERALKHVFGCLVPNGLFWFSINFDGETIFVPEDPLDSKVFDLYHRSMEPPVRNGSSTTGRRLLEAIPRLGATLLCAGSSDWVVYPSDGHYVGDEGYFLHHIVDTIRGALDGHPELTGAAWDRWIDRRHREVDEARLCYIAHQLDVLGRAPDT
jgi:SAM-dependent methyltransferase